MKPRCYCGATITAETMTRQAAVSGYRVTITCPECGRVREAEGMPYEAYRVAIRRMARKR